MPTRTIGGVSIDIRANDADFQKAVLQAAKNLRTFQKELRGTKRAANLANADLTKLAQIGGIGFLTGVGFSRLRSFTRETLDSLDAQIKYAKGLDITTERLQEYIFAFEEAGVTEIRLIRGLQRFQDELGRARNEGFGGAQLLTRIAALDEGTANLLLNTENAGEALDIFINFMARVEDAATRNAIALTALGRDVGPRFSAAVAFGNQALNDSRAQFRAWGLGLSDASVNVQQINDDWLAFTRFLEVRVKRVILENIALLHQLGDSVGLFSVPDTADEALRKSVNEARELLKQYEKDVQRFETALANADSPLERHVASFNLNRAQQAYERQAKVFRETFQRYLNNAPPIETKIGIDEQSLEEFVAEIRKASSDALRDALGQNQADIIAFQRAQETQRLTGPQIDTSQIEASRAADQAALDAFNANLARGQEIAVERQQLLNNALAAGAAALNNLGQVSDSTFSQIANGIGQTLDLLNNLGNLLQSVAKLLGGIGGLGPSGGAGGASSFFQFFDFFQHGGRVRPGQPTIVGEVRPEFFVPDSAGRIYPSVPGGATYITENHYTLDPSLDPVQQQQFFLQAIQINNRQQAQQRLRDARRPTPYRETLRENI